MLYFAYGVNMERFQMRRRCPGSRFVSKAKLADHELTFVRSSPSATSGVADLKMAKGKVVEGILWEITERDLKALDEYEGYPKEYIRRTVVVETPDGKKVQALAYTVVNPRGEQPPSRRYLNLLIQGAEEHNLSEEYIAFLESIRASG